MSAVQADQLVLSWNILLATLVGILLSGVSTTLMNAVPIFPAIVVGASYPGSA